MQGHATFVAYLEDLATAITTVRDSPDLTGGEVASSLSLQYILDEATRSLVEADVQIDLKEYSTNPSAFLDINRPIAIPKLSPEEEGSPLGSMIKSTLGGISTILESIFDERLNKEMAHTDDLGDSSFSVNIFDLCADPSSSEENHRMPAVDGETDDHPLFALNHLIAPLRVTLNVSQATIKGRGSDIPPYDLPPYLAAESNAHRISYNEHFAMPHESHEQLSYNHPKMMRTRRSLGDHQCA